MRSRAAQCAADFIARLHEIMLMHATAFARSAMRNVEESDLKSKATHPVLHLRFDGSKCQILGNLYLQNEMSGNAMFMVFN